jgi:hypothetical protein
MEREYFVKMYSKKTYIGDGAYVHFDGYHFILSTERENGWHEIGLEPSVFDALLKYRKQVYEDAEKLKNDKK